MSVATFARRFCRADGRAGATIRELVDGAPALDPLGVRDAWSGADSPRTCFRGIARVAGELDPPPSSAPLDQALLAATARAFDGGAALSLSGGLDSALILAWARELGLAPPVYVLSAQLGDRGYDERDAACALARRFGVEPMVVEASAEEFVAALPACVRAVETALYNLHPVAKLLLARRAAGDGARVVVTGDGADQIFAGASGADYLPLVGALFGAAGVAPRSPFLDEDVIACARAASPDAGKSRLRAIALKWLPDELARAPKLRRLAPPLELARFWDDARAARLATTLGATVEREDDRARVQWTTLLLLCEQLAIGLD